MNRELERFFREQYSVFREGLIKRWGVSEKQINDLDWRLKPIHKRYLSLACLATVIGSNAKRSEYIEGVIEVNHLSLVLAAKGLENPACVLLRQSIELVLKHIYFSTHAVEYGWALTREDYRDLTFQSLLEYLNRTDEFGKLVNAREISVKINEWFGVLSRHVHVHSKGFLGYSKINSAYKPRVEIIDKFDIATKNIWPALMIVLIINNPEKYSKATIMEQYLIRNGLTNILRNKLDNYLYQWSK